MFNLDVLIQATKDFLEYNTLDPVLSNFMKGIKDNNPDQVKRYANSENINHKCDGGLRPLHYAAKYAKGQAGKEIMEFLLHNGADPKIPDVCGVTPLIMAAENCNVRAIEALLGNVDAKDTLNWGRFISKETALHHALFHYGPGGEGLEIAKALIEAGADIDSTSRVGTTPRGFIKQVDLFKDLREMIPAISVPHNEEGGDITDVPPAGLDAVGGGTEDLI